MNIFTALLRCWLLRWWLRSPSLLARLLDARGRPHLAQEEGGAAEARGPASSAKKRKKQKDAGEAVAGGPPATDGAPGGATPGATPGAKGGLSKKARAETAGVAAAAAVAAAMAEAPQAAQTPRTTPKRVKWALKRIELFAPTGAPQTEVRTQAATSSEAGAGESSPNGVFVRQWTRPQTRALRRAHALTARAPPVFSFSLFPGGTRGALVRCQEAGAEEGHTAEQGGAHQSRGVLDRPDSLCGDGCCVVATLS